MTRFARAKGSKASNERIPEQATSWTQMKQQMLSKKQEQEENKERSAILEKRNANYKAFLEEKEEEESKNVKWAEFPGVNKEAKRKIERSNNGSNNSDDEPPEESSFKVKPAEIVVKKVKNVKNKPLKIVSDVDAPKGKKRKLSLSEVESEKTKSKTKKSKKEKAELDKEKQNNAKDKPKNLDNLTEAEKLKIEKKKQRRLKQIQKKNAAKAQLREAQKQSKEKGKPKLSEDDIKKIEQKKQKKIKQLLKKKQFKEEKMQVETPISDGQPLENNSTNAKPEVKPEVKPFKNNEKNNVKPKFEKPVNKPPKKNKKPKENGTNRKHKPEKWTINGKQIDVEYFDGFPIKKDDADRLRTLKKEMISKGLPRSEINVALKLERRKAEKAFAREKKKVCFNCRKSGHNLSECPELEKDQIAMGGTGICFKCGSTEHTHFECKVVRGETFKYAQCFICNEQGHIAKQCPDNARGLYPKGGACKVCGDVTHLKRDCPKYQAQQQQLSQDINLSVFDGGNPDDLDNTRKVSFSQKKPNKVIKFS